jgi:gliding motility-associated-like protein
MKDSFHTKIKNINEFGLTRILLLVSLFLLMSIKGLAQPLTVNPTATPNPVCAGAIVQLNAGASGGSGSYTYTWTSIPPGFTSTIINPTDNPAVTTTYYVAVFDGINTVDGQVTVTVTDPAAPTGSSPQSFCSVTSPTLASIVITGTLIKWYAASSGGSALPNTTPLVTGTTYYASQTISGCESDTRLAVAVTVTDPAAPTGSSPQSFCSVTSPTLANIVITGTLIKWYAASSGGSALPNTTPLVTGTTYYASQTISGCESDTRLAIAVTLTANNTITRTSTSGTDAQTVCLNTAITNITYATTGATGATFSGLPAGVTGSWAGNVVTISGSPSISVGSPFNYTVALTGGCGTVSANGSITVTPSNTITLSSGVGTNNQTVCSGTAINNITFATTGATGATVTGLPTGITGTWATNVVTISGTPVGVGAFPYIVTLTGGCGLITATGTITLNPVPVPTLTSSAPGNVSCAGTNVTFTAGGGTNYSFRIGGVIKQTGPSNTYTTNILTNGNIVDVIVTNASGCSATSAGIFNFVNQPPFIFISTPTTCSTDFTTYSLAVTVSTGTVTSTSGTVTSIGGNVWTITNIPKATNITVKVTDSGGCENSLAVSAPDCTCPVVLAPVSGGDKSYCASGIIPTINATVLSGETVDWYNTASGGAPLRSGSLSYTPTAAGTFYAQARNTTTNCISSTRTPVTVTMNPLPIPTLISSDPDNIFCAGTSVTFTAGGGTNYNFRVGGVSVLNGALTTYTTTSLTNGQVVDVIVTNANGCSATSAGITNTVNSLPVPTLTSSDADNRFCLGTSVTFTAGGGTNYNFTVGGISVQSGASATYTTDSLTNGQVVNVVVTNANGCVATSAGITNSVYAIPAADAGSGGNNCGLGFHLNATLNVGVGTWSKVSGPGDATFSPDANAANAIVTVTAYGTYTFRWTVVNGTCSTNATVTVIFIQQPPANAGSGGNSCNKEFILNALVPSTGTGTWTKATGPGNAVFTPDNHNPNATVDVDQFGLYSFAWTVINSTCTSSDIVSVTFHDLPPINAGSDTTICKGSSIQLYAQGAGSVSWIPVALVSNPDIINPIATPDTTTTFTVNLTDQFGCKNSDSIVVEVREKVTADAGPDQILGYIFTTTMDARLAYSYEKGIWSVISGTGEFIDSTYAKTTVNGLSSGENKFLWTVTNGFCPISHDTVLITVNGFVIPTLITPNMDGKNDYFVLRGLATLGKTELIIFDRRGVQVYRNMNYDNLWNGVDYNNKPLPDDTYFYIIKTANGKSISGYVVIRR